MGFNGFMDLSKLSQQPYARLSNGSATAHELILQEAVFKLETHSTTLQGTIEWPGGGVLDIDFSTVRPGRRR